MPYVVGINNHQLLEVDTTGKQCLVAFCRTFGWETTYSSIEKMSTFYMLNLDVWGASFCGTGKVLYLTLTLCWTYCIPSTYWSKESLLLYSFIVPSRCSLIKYLPCHNKRSICFMWYQSQSHLSPWFTQCLAPMLCSSHSKCAAQGMRDITFHTLVVRWNVVFLYGLGHSSLDE